MRRKHEQIEVYWTDYPLTRIFVYAGFLFVNTYAPENGMVQFVPLK